MRIMDSAGQSTDAIAAHSNATSQVSSTAPPFREVYHDAEGLFTDNSPDRGRIERTAASFEALLIGHLIKSAHAGGGWFGAGEDQSASVLMEMGAECFASALSAGGGLGIARMVANSISRETAKQTSTEPSDSR